MAVVAAIVARMDSKELFLLADAALRDVLDRIQLPQLALPAPAAWTRTPDPTLRDILAGHAKDEAWVPDVLAGRTIAEVGGTWEGDLLGDDPIAAYDRFNDLATAAVKSVTDLDAVAHLSYGDLPVSVYFEHTAFFRGFQAPLIARLIGVDWAMPPALVDGLWDTVMPQLDGLRAIHVFGPEVAVPAGSSKEVQLLGKTGFYGA